MNQGPPHLPVKAVYLAGLARWEEEKTEPQAPTNSSGAAYSVQHAQQTLPTPQAVCNPQELLGHLPKYLSIDWSVCICILLQGKHLRHDGVSAAWVAPSLAGIWQKLGI